MTSCLRQGWLCTSCPWWVGFSNVLLKTSHDGDGKTSLGSLLPCVAGTVAGKVF